MYTPTTAALRTWTPLEVRDALVADLVDPEVARIVMLEAREHVPYQEDVHVPAAWWARVSPRIARVLGVEDVEQYALEGLEPAAVRAALAGVAA